jgi:hypothetical protein
MSDPWLTSDPGLRWEVARMSEAVGAAGDDEQFWLAEYRRRDDDLSRDEALWRDDDLCGDESDPAAGPPDGEEAWLADLPADLRDQHLTEPWTGAGEAMAAGFLRGPGFLPGVGGRPGVGFAAGGALDQLVPGQALAGFAADTWTAGLAELGESELIGVLCAWRRLASWAAAGETEAVITLARRRSIQARERRRPALIDHVSDEVAAALVLTGRGGDRLLELAGGLARLDATRAALAAGVIDWPRASVFADELVALSDEDARKVEAMVLPRAGELTTGQLRAALRRAVLKVDPDAVPRRRRAARKDAAVHLWDEASGNCALAGRELPPAEAITADQWLTAQARWLQAHGTDGTLQQLRIAVFAAVLNGRPVASLLPQAQDTEARPPGPDSTVAGQHHPAGTTQSAVTGTVNLTMPLTAWLGTSEAPGEVPGYGSADADTCRDLAGQLAAHSATRWCLTLTDRDGHAVAHACARAGPGPPGQAAAMVARWLASLRPVRLESGECTHRLVVPGYRPPRSLRHLVGVRQRTCGFPGCRRPATRCDDDHTIPYDRGGLTCECNLAPLCKS